MYKYFTIFLPFVVHAASIERTFDLTTPPFTSPSLESSSQSILTPLLSSINSFSRTILEHDLNLKSNHIIESDQAFILLSFLANLPGDNLLKTQLIEKKDLFSLETFKVYRLYIKNFLETYNAMIIKSTKDLTIDPSIISSFGVESWILSDDTSLEEEAKSINFFVQKFTKDKIKDIINPEDLIGLELGVLSVSYLKSRWRTAFEKEEVGAFKTIDSTKPVTYLCGNIIGGYKSSSMGEIITIPLLNGAKYAIFKPKPGVPISFDFENLSEVKEGNLKLKMPKISIQQKINLKKTLTSLGFDGLSNKFIENKLSLGSFFQQSFLKTTKEGLEAGAASWAGLYYGGTVEVVIDVPHAIAIMVPIAKDKYFPICMGYIGDPTLTGTEEETVAIDRALSEGASGGAGDGPITIPST